jgi:thymidylate synthase
MIQYAAFLIAVAHVVGRKASWYYHTFDDAHYYDTQIEFVDELVRRKPLPFPKLELTDDAPNDIFAFRPHHFVLSEYVHHDPIKNIPVAV